MMMLFEQELKRRVSMSRIYRIDTPGQPTFGITFINEGQNKHALAVILIGAYHRCLQSICVERIDLLLAERLLDMVVL